MLLDTRNEELLELADDMAAAATNFRGQGYEQFLKARETFKDRLYELQISKQKLEAALNGFEIYLATKKSEVTK
jgi:hypothetical protein